MTADVNTTNLIISLGKPEDMDTETYVRLVRNLIRQVNSLDVELTEQEARLENFNAETKGNAQDIQTLGVLTLLVVQNVLPQVLMFLQNWTKQKDDQKITVKAQKGDHSIEIEFPVNLPPEKVKAHLNIITGQFWKKTR